MAGVVRKLSNKGVGPGGYKCHCCGPSPKNRPQHRRLVRRQLARFAAREILEAMETLVQKTT